MVAPTGVSEGIPQDPAQAEAAGTEAEPAEAEPAEAEPAEAEPAEAGAAERLERVEVAGPEAGPPAVDTVEAEPAADANAQAEPPESELAEGELANSELAEGGPAEAGAGGPAEAEADSPATAAAEGSRDFRPLAVAGIIIVVLALVGVAVGVLDVITHGFRPKVVVTYRPAAVFGLRPGECINSGANALNVIVVSCAAPHDAEVFATFSLPETSWPGATVAQLDAGDGCVTRLSAYLNPALATAALTQEYVYPNQSAWQAGEHTVVCEIRAVSGPLTGSVRAKS